MSAVGLSARPLRGRWAAGYAEELGFFALALLGALRWNTLLSPGAGWRLPGLAILALALYSAGRRIERRRVGVLPLLLLLLLLGLAATLMMSGWPASWVLHLRLALIWQTISAGVVDLPRALVPYNGINHEIREVIILGGGALMLLAALVPALQPRRSTLAGRTLACVPLLVLEVLPVTLVPPGVPGAEGALLLLILCIYVWGPRIVAAERPGVLAVIGGAILIALPLAGALRPERPWLSPLTLANRLGPGDVARFDWSQTYGVLHWPREGREVLSISARRPELWKAENLDAFNGTGWVLAASPQIGEPAVPASVRARFTQTITVTVRSLAAPQVITAGDSLAPTGVAGLEYGVSPGTWLSARGIGPGDSYRVQAYDPHPTVAELSASSSEPGESLVNLRSMTLPVPLGGTPGSLLFTFGAYRTSQPRVVAPGEPSRDAAALMKASPYAEVYALARRLAAGTRGPGGVIDAVLRYLGRGYRYDERPPASSLPLVSFLLSSPHLGYCQHFAGAMALLLRMDGIPARVSTGFTRGIYDPGTRAWIVEDIGAHAWVEAWLPGYGWVSFDPTPRVAPELSGLNPAPSPGTPLPHRPAGTHGLAAGAPPTHHGSSGLPSRRAGNLNRPGGTALGPLALALTLMLIALAGLRGVRLRRPTPEAYLAELERAMRRLGRPLAPGDTLAGLEARMAGAPEAVSYVRRLRQSRYGPSAEFQVPSRRERTALRRELCIGAGRAPRLRGWWALPPLWVFLN